MGKDSGGRVFRNYCKGHVDKTMGDCGNRGGRWVWLRYGVEGWGEMQTIVIDQQ